MLHKFSAWTHLSNFDQPEQKLDVERDNGEQSQKQLSSLTVKSGWIFSFRGQFEIKILIVRHI